MGTEQAWPLGKGVARIPLAVKVVYTLFLIVMVWNYLPQYGPLNFLWFCDVALVVTAVGIWLESPLLISMQAVGITLPQIAWVVDLFVRLCTGEHFPIDFTEYMFNPKIDPFIRGLSLFHGWLPFLLLWLVWRLGYDRRAWLGETILGSTVLLLSFLLVTVNDPAHAGNVNKVFGMNDDVPQTALPPLAWVGALMVIASVGVYLPTHFLFRWLMPAAPLPSSTQHPYTS